ncbi:MAG TPA: hypothetical protein PKJ98_12065 [Verrucomicrobiota bacterium]|nr:hypothetical protein [Verrucomicrobiota bacterium]
MNPWRRVLLPVLGVLAAAVVLQAERFTFDGPNDIAGQHVPPPLISDAEYWGIPEGGVPTIVAGRGVGGSQALSTPFAVNSQELYTGGAIYVLPRPLTQADGAVRISVMFFPQPSLHNPSDPSTRYWAYCGGMTIGSGKGPDANYQQIRFEANFDHNFVDTPRSSLSGPREARAASTAAGWGRLRPPAASTR